MTTGQFVPTHTHAVAVQWTGATTLPFSGPNLALLALETFSSKLSPSLVSQGDLDFGSLEVIVGHFIHFALIPKRI